MAVGLDQRREDHVVGVRHARVVLELAVERVVEELAGQEERTPRGLLVVGEPRRVRSHGASVLEYLNAQ